MHQSPARRGARRSAGLGFGILAVGMLLALLIGLVQPSAAGASESDDYVARINSLRASVGVQSLGVDGELSGLAQACANRLAASGSLVHSGDLSIGVSSRWTKLGENIGMGPRNDTIWTAFVHSSQHYANLVDPAFNRVGVGVAYAGGSQWTCHRFMAISGGGGQPAAARSPAPRATTPKAPQVAAPPAPAPDPIPEVVVPPPPLPGPPPPADAARVSAVLHALHVLTGSPTPVGGT